MSEENAPATKADVQAVGSEFRTDIKAFESRLNAFYAFAQTNDRRMTMLEDTDSKIVPLLGAIESRVIEIERRLNIPPAA